MSNFTSNNEIDVTHSTPSPFSNRCTRGGQNGLKEFAGETSTGFYRQNVNEQTPLQNDLSSCQKHDLFIYENILQEIRGMRVLSSSQLNLLSGMSRRKLLYIISMYNMIIRNVNEIL